MQKRSFKIVAIFSLFFFLATPIGAFAQCGPGGCAGGGQGGSGSQGIDPMSLLLGGALSGGLGGAGGGAGGPAGQFAQLLTGAGALSGNMGLLVAGMLMKLLGGLGGSTPQQGNPDEQYVRQGQGFGSGGGGNPYYPTPAPTSNLSNANPSATCASSLFIVKDTTTTPNVTKPYPANTSIAQNNCVLAINSDSSSHTVQVKKQGDAAVLNDQAVGASNSHIFRFSTKNTYTLCVDGVAAACTTVTVQ